MGICVSKSAGDVSSGGKNYNSLLQQRDDDYAPDVADSDSDSCYNTINGPEDLLPQSVNSFKFGSDALGIEIDVDQMFSGRSVICGYKKVKLLGKGASSEVYEMEKLGKHFAAKFCYVSPITVNFLNLQNHQPKEEAVILRNFNFPFIIKIYDIYTYNILILTRNKYCSVFKYLIGIIFYFNFISQWR